MRAFITLCLLSLSLLATEPSPLSDAHQQVLQDLQKSRQELNTLTQKISLEKRQHQEAFEQKITQLKALRLQLKNLRHESAQLKAVKTQKIQQDRQQDHLHDYLAQVTQAYRKEFESRLSFAQRQALQEQLKIIDQDLHKKQYLRALNSLLQSSQEQLQFKPIIRQTSLVDSSSLIISGEIIEFGPIAFFQTDSQAGIALQQAAQLEPLLFNDLDAPQQRAIQQLFSQGEASLPIDVSGGLSLDKNNQESLLDHLQKGGLVIIPLLLLAIVTLLLSLYKFVSLHRLSVHDVELKISTILQKLNEGDESQARSLASQLGMPLSVVIEAGIDHRLVPREHIEEVMYERILSTLPHLEKYLSALAVSAAAAPLLGLLGTVTGMIDTFKMITLYGSGNASLLSGGISEALITTEIGLLIAVPTLLIHAYLSRRVKRILANTQQASIMFVNSLAVDHSTAPEKAPEKQVLPEASHDA